MIIIFLEQALSSFIRNSFYIYINTLNGDLSLFLQSAEINAPVFYITIMNLKKKNIALFMGGNSGEYEVSIGSASVVSRNIDRGKFNVFPILVHGNEWIYLDEDSNRFMIDKNDFSVLVKGKKTRFQGAFIAIHGSPGEDGKLQGYLDLMNVPYTSCDLTVSALTFNKYFCNDLAIRYGANVAKTILLRPRTKWTSTELIRELGLPCFVKPNKSGSSVGVSKVSKEEDFTTAIGNGFIHDNEVLVQEFIKGRELACGVFRQRGKVVVLPVTEIVSKKEFFDYEAKYTPGMAEEITPALISPEEEKECNSLTSYLYEKFNCKGVVRFDYFLTEKGLWFLEVNTVPGFSEGSLVPKQALAAGYSLLEFFTGLVDELFI
jgi:D-alanine-D-alanine ligase